MRNSNEIVKHILAENWINMQNKREKERERERDEAMIKRQKK